MKIAVLTSSIGCTKLLDPKPFDGVDYHAFIDYEDDSTSWIKHPVIPFSTDARYKNCLLYTSPSPRDRTRSRMPSSA